MKVYQLNNKLERKYFKLDLKDIKNDKELVKAIIKNYELFDYNSFGDYAIYVEKIPKKICKFKELTIILNKDSGETRYFSGLC